MSDSGPKRKDTFEHSVQDVVKEAKSRGWIKRHCRAWDGNFPCSEIKLQLQVKAECRRSQGCAVARPAVAGNDEGMPVRPETLGIVSLATSAPGLEVRFAFYKVCWFDSFPIAVNRVYAGGLQTAKAITPIGPA